MAYSIPYFQTYPSVFEMVTIDDGRQENLKKLPSSPCSTMATIKVPVTPVGVPCCPQALCPHRMSLTRRHDQLALPVLLPAVFQNLRS